MKQQTLSAEARYNASLTVADITRNELFSTTTTQLLTYSKVHDVCDGIEVHLGNMAGGFPFEFMGRLWPSSEHLYLCGEWSLEGQKYADIQADVISCTSGYACKRFKKTKYKKEIRPDYPEFRHQWMLFVVWTKCQRSKAFAQHLLSMPDDRIIVEVIKHDPVWAAYYDSDNRLVGENGMGKILTICRNCLKNNTVPDIDRDMLNKANIWILGKHIEF